MLTLLLYWKKWFGVKIEYDYRKREYNSFNILYNSFTLNIKKTSSRLMLHRKIKINLFLHLSQSMYVIFAAQFIIVPQKVFK